MDKQYFINGIKCKEYIEKLKVLEETPVKDLSRLDESAFRNWKVVEPAKLKSI